MMSVVIDSFIIYLNIILFLVFKLVKKHNTDVVVPATYKEMVWEKTYIIIELCWTQMTIQAQVKEWLKWLSM